MMDASTAINRSHEERDANMANVTPKEFALKVGSDPRTVRKFLRSQARENGTETPGKGSRWEIDSRSVRSLQKRFQLWIDAKNAKTEEATETE